MNPLFRVDGEGEKVNILGESILFRVRSSETGGAFCCVEEVSPPGGGVPPHSHSREDELFYVTDGLVEFHCGDNVFRAEPGSHALCPKNIPHSFKNIGSKPSKMIVTMFPGGFDQFFVEVDELPKGLPPDMEKISQIAARYGLKFL